MEDVTRLSRCARCGASLPLDHREDLCPACREALAPGREEVTVLSVAPAGGPVELRLTAGQTFGPYRIERLLGRGGMGDVYQAEHLEHGRRVAVKMLNGAFAGAADRALFLREGELAASITHPNAVYVFGSEVIDGAPVIAMELLSGGTLRDLVQAKGPFPPAQAVDAILQVVAGLDAAARTGILHRDVKPANCFVDLQGTIKVGDFGLSISTRAHQQTTGMFLGTPQFAPPEQIRGEPLDARADIYAVGGTLFYLLTGEPPFDDRDLTTLVTRVTTESPRAMRANVPLALADIVTSCLAKDREARPPSYRDLEDRLRPFSSAAPVVAGLGRRFLAGAVDYGLFMLAIVPLSMYLQFSGLAMHRWAMGLINMPIWIAYFSAFEGRWGASIGKRLAGLRVARPDGQRPGLGRATLRVLVYQAPALVAIMPVLAIGPATVDRLAIEHPLAGAAMALLSYLALALLFVTARRRNGFAALQDLASGTRVVLRRGRLERVAIDLGADAPTIAAGPPIRIGPFDVIRTLGATDRGELRLGFDPQLKRRVWIHVQPPGASAVSTVLRELARPARLRWLGGRRLPDDAWDAYEAFDGVALTMLPSALPWRVVRRWVLDLAQEINTGLRDGSLGVLTLDRVWITRDGRAKLLDFRAPGPTAGEALSSEPALGAAETWLARIARRGLADPPAASSRHATPPLPMTLPLSARILLDRLDEGAFATFEAIVSDITALLPRPDHASRARRAASILLPALAPVILTLLGVGAAIGMRAVAASTPDTDALAVALSYLDGLSRRADPGAADERRHVETYIAATYRTTLARDGIWSNPLTGPKLMPYRPLAEQVLARHPIVTPDELAEATASLGPFVLAQQKALKAQQDQARRAPRAAAVAMFGMGLGLAAGGGIIFATMFGGGLFLRVCGLAVVNRHGRRASRAHAVLRALVAWAPAGALVYMTFASPVLFRDLAYATSHLGSAAMIGSAAVLFLAGALLAAVRPARGVQDVIARTHVVPR